MGCSELSRAGLGAMAGVPPLQRGSWLPFMERPTSGIRALCPADPRILAIGSRIRWARRWPLAPIPGGRGIGGGWNDRYGHVSSGLINPDGNQQSVVNDPAASRDACFAQGDRRYAF